MIVTRTLRKFTGFESFSLSLQDNVHRHASLTKICAIVVISVFLLTSNFRNVPWSSSYLFACSATSSSSISTHHTTSHTGASHHSSTAHHWSSRWCRSLVDDNWLAAIAAAVASSRSSKAHVDLLLRVWFWYSFNTAEYALEDFQASNMSRT